MLLSISIPTCSSTNFFSLSLSRSLPFPFPVPSSSCLSPSPSFSPHPYPLLLRLSPSSYVLDHRHDVSTSPPSPPETGVSAEGFNADPSAVRLVSSRLDTATRGMNTYITGIGTLWDREIGKLGNWEIGMVKMGHRCFRRVE